MQANQNLVFPIDSSQLEGIQRQLGATTREVKKAFNRALKRTAVTMNKLSGDLINHHVSLRQKKSIKKRFNQFRVTKDGFDGLKLWFGLNPLPISFLAGRISKKGAKKNPTGAIFTSKSQSIGRREYDGSFVAVRGKNKYRSVFSRVGKGRWNIEEKTIEIDDALLVKIEDEIFVKLPDVFWNHFKSDLRGRVTLRNS